MSTLPGGSIRPTSSEERFTDLRLPHSRPRLVRGASLERTRRDSANAAFTPISATWQFTSFECPVAQAERERRQILPPEGVNSVENRRASAVCGREFDKTSCASSTRETITLAPCALPENFGE